MPAKVKSTKQTRRKRWDGLKLDVWCGQKKSEGFTGFDSRPRPGVDVVHDLYDFPWPFPDSCADQVIFSHIMEKMDPSKVMAVFDEVWRIMKPKGNLFVSTWYANSFMAHRDPANYRVGYNEDTPFFWDPTRRAESGEWLYEWHRPKPWQVSHLDFELGHYVNWVMHPLKRLDGGPMRVRVPPLPEK